MGSFGSAHIAGAELRCDSSEQPRLVPALSAGGDFASSNPGTQCHAWP